MEEKDNNLFALSEEFNGKYKKMETEFYRKEKNLLASLNEISDRKSELEDENKKLSKNLLLIKKQSEQMSGMIESIRDAQGKTDQRVLQAAQVQAAVLSKTEEESARERDHQAAESRLRDEIQKLSQENTFLKQELAGFDVQFFEELEQLKYAYAQSVAQVKSLTKQLDAIKASAGGARTQ